MVARGWQYRLSRMVGSSESLSHRFVLTDSAQVHYHYQREVGSHLWVLVSHSNRLRSKQGQIPQGECSYYTICRSHLCPLCLYVLADSSFSTPCPSHPGHRTSLLILLLGNCDSLPPLSAPSVSTIQTFHFPGFKSWGWIVGYYLGSTGSSIILKPSVILCNYYIEDASSVLCVLTMGLTFSKATWFTLFSLHLPDPTHKINRYFRKTNL